MDIEELQRKKPARISIPEAAEIMDVDPQFLRIVLQKGRFPFGVAVKRGRWAYYINTRRFINYMKDREAWETFGRGISKTTDGIVYAFEYEERKISAEEDMYKIKTYVKCVNAPIRFNNYYVPGEQLDDFFDNWSDHREKVIDIRPITKKQAEMEIAEYEASKCSVNKKGE